MGNIADYPVVTNPGKVAGREVASVIGAQEIKAIAKSAPPRAGTTRVERLRGGQYVRIWINDVRAHYIVNLRLATTVH